MPGRTFDDDDEPIADTYDLPPAPYASIWRKQEIGRVEIGSGTNNITVQALMQIGDFVNAETRKGKITNLRPVTDAFEFELQGHRVRVLLGEAAEQ